MDQLIRSCKYFCWFFPVRRGNICFAHLLLGGGRKGAKEREDVLFIFAGRGGGRRSGGPVRLREGMGGWLGGGTEIKNNYTWKSKKQKEENGGGGKLACLSNVLRI